jgi:ribosomal protein S18 acetylase RimI-like enzyme
MSNLMLRALQPTDLDRVSEIDSRTTGYPRKAFFEKRLAAATRGAERFITTAAVDGGKLVGYGFARLQEGEFGTTGLVADLDVIGVDPEFQGMGIGKALFTGIEQRMKEKNIATVRTQVSWADSAMTGFFSSVGFKLAPSQIIERDTSPLSEEVAEVKSVTMDSVWQVHGNPSNDYETLSRDRVLVRSLKTEDLTAVVRIDGKYTGRDRTAYYAGKFKEMLSESGIRVSLVAEDDGLVTGFVMARVDFGEFGKVEKAAVIDTIGIHPAYKGSGIGHALLSQLMINLATLQVELVRTQVLWENFELQRFLHARGFGLSQRLVLTKTID